MPKDKFKEFTEALKEISEQCENDIEFLHIRMDNLLVKTLEDEGYDCRIFDEATKWYA